VSQQLPSPPLVPSSMQSGGQLPGNKFLAEMTSPVTGPPVQVSVQHLPEPVASADGTNREVLEPGASVAAPQVPARDKSTGRFVTPMTTVKVDGVWRLTPGAN
jgi:hypothetical protein